MKIVRLLLLAVSCSLFLYGCGQGGGGNPNASHATLELDEIVAPPENGNAYTVVVYLPVVSNTTTTTIYDSLYTNITSSASQAKLPISRVLLSAVSPSTHGVFNVSTDVGSLAVSFLTKVAAYNKANPSKLIQVFAYPDVGTDGAWLNWAIPTQYLSIPSCKLSQTTQDQSQKAMLLSICWTSAVNQLIGSNVLLGVVYDQQSNWLKSTNPTTQIPWTYTQAHNDSLLIGWISGNGVAASAGKVDLNFVEVYDLYANGYPYYDSLALETIPTVVQQPGTCVNGLCTYEEGNAVKKPGDLPSAFFPGTQYTYPYTDSKGNAAIAGVVGANIYQCAISKDLGSDSCTSAYSTNVDTSQPPSAQVLQAINYIWNFVPKQALTAPHYGPKNSLSGNVIYLFSTQYIGPQKSYFASATVTSKNQCADPSAPTTQACSCIATQYNPHAFCGGENGFGSWGNYYSEFVQFTTLFLNSQGGGNCPGQSCSAGIYMYDYIPQAWYSQ